MGSVAELLEPRKVAFLAELSRHGIISRACEVAGLNRATAYELKGRDGEFAERWGEALSRAADAIEYEAHRRSVEGVEKLLFQKGTAVIDPRTGEPYVERTYSDTILLARLKAMKPEAYRERLDIKSEAVGGALEIEPSMLLRLTADERQTLLVLLDKLQEAPDGQS